MHRGRLRLGHLSGEGNIVASGPSGRFATFKGHTWYPWQLVDSSPPESAATLSNLERSSVRGNATYATAIQLPPSILTAPALGGILSRLPQPAPSVPDEVIRG